MKKKKKERKIALEDKAPVSTLATRVPIYIPYRTRPRRWNYFSWSSIGLKVNPWEGISPIYLNKADNLCCLFICFLAEKKKKKKTPSESFDDSIGALCSPRIIHSDPWKLYVGKQKSDLFVSLSHFQQALSRRVAVRFFPSPTLISNNMLRHSTHRFAIARMGCIVLVWYSVCAVECATIKNSTLLLFFPFLFLFISLSFSLLVWFLRRI